jgi:hypothetical protein
VNTQPIRDTELELAYLRAYGAHLADFFAQRRAALGIAQPQADPRAQWAAGIEARVKLGMPRSKAIVALMRERPDIRKAYDATAR